MVTFLFVAGLEKFFWFESDSKYTENTVSKCRMPKMIFALVSQLLKIGWSFATGTTRNHLKRPVYSKMHDILWAIWINNQGKQKMLWWLYTNDMIDNKYKYVKCLAGSDGNYILFAVNINIICCYIGEFELKNHDWLRTPLMND